MNLIDKLEAGFAKKNITEFHIGDTVKVHVRIIEGEKDRTQIYEGIVIGRQGSGIKETFTVRKISYGVGVERVFPLHAPRVEKIEVVKKGSVKRAKLYYLRDRIGKQAIKIKELRDDEEKK